ncbi:MAG: LuxR family transcriptional regulator [Peptococcaceae bacterium BICA1-7]|nr:MAG: LuxR family transcriptional regulator [Peptococcaceae bacterium BICA1-7]HBV95609.1 DNA-binding response regulator [Desulfotomaculum sp.]
MTEQTGKKVRVLVVDDQELMRDGLASLLGIQEGIEVAGTAANGQEAIDRAVDLLPDIVLMDIRMPVMDGITATGHLRRQLPQCRVIMLTTFNDEEYIVKALISGAVGYLLKDIPARDLARAVQLAHLGIYQLEPSVAGKLVGTIISSSQAGHPPAAGSLQEKIPSGLPRPALPDTTGLKDRELEVLRLIATGATNREIAVKLYISEGTVKNHVSSILNCLGLRDRTQAAIYAFENKLV